MIGKQRQSLVNGHRSQYRQLSKDWDRNNGKSTPFSTQNGVIGSSTTSSSVPDTATYTQVGNRWTTSNMPRSWSTSFIESTRGTHIDREQLWFGIGGERSVGCFILFLVYWMPARYKWRWQGFYHLRIAVTWRWTIPVRRIHRLVSNYGANRQREIGVWRTL